MSQILTEEEAKKKWCPLARQHGGINRTYIPEGGEVVSFGEYGVVTQGYVPVTKPARECFCIASACMAWEVVDTGISTMFLEDSCRYQQEEEVFALLALRQEEGWSIVEGSGFFARGTSLFPRRLQKINYSGKGQCSAMTNTINVETSCSH